jgi:hypothetical protein
VATVYAIKLRNNIFLATWTIHSLIPFLPCRTEIDQDQLPSQISMSLTTLVAAPVLRDLIIFVVLSKSPVFMAVLIYEQVVCQTHR